MRGENFMVSLRQLLMRNINIAPKAYSKTGSSFPAQVRFESLWICHPLSENEFRDAICENYFAPWKFNFGLSREQVTKLVELFSLKKKSPRSRDSLDNDNSVNVDTTEQCAVNDTHSKCRLGAHHSMFNENPVIVLEDPNADIEHRSYPRVHLPNSTCSMSPVHHSGEQSYFVGSKSPFDYTTPCFGGEQPSGVLCASRPNFAQTLTETQALHTRTHPYPSYPDPETYKFSATKYHNQDRFNELGVDIPNSAQRFTETQVPMNSFQLEQATGTLRSHSHPSQQAPTTFRLPFTDNHGHVSSFHDDYLPLQTERRLNFNYGPSTLEAYANNAKDYLHSVHGVSNTHRYAETSKEVDTSRGLRYWKLMPNNPNLPLVEDDLPYQVPGRYSSEPCDADACSEEEERYFSKGSSISASSKLQSEMLPRRTSVFSRLSKAPKSFPSRDDDDDDDDRFVGNNASLDLLKLLSRRINQWNTMSKASKRSFPRLHDDDDERLENVDSMEPADAELASESAGADEESMEIPFINFKRRSGAKDVDEKTGGTIKRRKLIRPSSAENEPTDDESKGISALEASFGNKKHMNPKDNAGGAEAVVPTDTTDERILGSKENIKDTPKANFPVDYGTECLESSVENNDVNFDKISNATRKDERKKELILAADSIPDGEKNTLGRNPKQVSQASAISAEGAGTEEHSIFKSDFEYEGNKSTMLLDLNREATHLESNPNISKARAGLGMNKHNVSESGLKFEGNRSDGLNETATMILDLNCEATSRDVIESCEDNRRDGSLSDGNRENVSPIFNTAPITMNDEGEEAAREGNYSGLPI